MHQIAGKIAMETKRPGPIACIAKGNTAKRTRRGESAIGVERLNSFSDGVIAVIITIMVLELKAPESAKLADLLPLWPTGLSYAVSYLFLAIIWVNHHHLMQFAKRATQRLVWINFGHLFAVSLVPFTTAWVAQSRLAAEPVALYAVTFVCVNLAFRLFENAVLAQAGPDELCQLARRMARRRSLGTLLIFGLASCLAWWLPYAAFALICVALLLYLRPEAPGAFANTSSDR
jgi:uncharacterized membrane protein